MNRWEMRKQFGKHPSLNAVLIYSIQHALKGYGVRHLDAKRQRKTKMRDCSIAMARTLKQGQV